MNATINTHHKIRTLEDMKVRFSTLWIFVMLNYLYADVLSLFDSKILNQLLTGNTGSVQMTPEVLLAAAILMESAIMMVLLSRTLNYRANRWANIIVGILHTLAVFGSLFGDRPTAYYIFFSVIEIACTMFIVWYAWQWTTPEVQPA